MACHYALLRLAMPGAISTAVMTGAVVRSAAVAAGQCGMASAFMAFVDGQSAIASPLPSGPPRALRDGSHRPSPHRRRSSPAPCRRRTARRARAPDRATAARLGDPRRSYHLLHDVLAGHFDRLPGAFDVGGGP